MRTAIYTPIIKAKRYDLAALGDVDPSKRCMVRPLLELAEYESTDCDAILQILLKRLSQFTWPLAPYVDLYSFLPNATVATGVNATIAGFQSIAAANLNVIPTYGFQRNDTLWGDLGSVARRLGAGFCFRVDIEDLDDQAEQTWSDIIERSAEMRLTGGLVDIVVDLRFVGAIQPKRLLALTQEFLAIRPNGFGPRTIVIAGSSALKTVSSVPVDGTSAVLRQELLLWAQIQLQLSTPEPLAFGDYGVIHPDFSQSAPSPNANAKIRYTRGDSIHYFRGTRLFRPSNFSQYHGLARRVAQSPQYRGRHYSVGDGEVWNCANRSERPGNLGIWVRIDQNHHIETTIDQISEVITQLAQGAAPSRLIETLQEA